MATPTRILGLDPGYGIMGWGLVEQGQRRDSIQRSEHGTIETPARMPTHERMLLIQNETLELFTRTRPDLVVVEKLFVNRNLKTAGDVYQARGVVLAAIAQFGCELSELTPNQIKHMLTGRGRASKDEVLIMVMRMLGLTTKIRPDDAADALAAALCGAFMRRSQSVLEAAGAAASGPLAAATPRPAKARVGRRKPGIPEGAP